MSIRQRIPFKLGDDGYVIDEQGHVLDEQEQEEVIERLKEQSEKRNAQYSVLLQALVVLSAVLHIIFLFSPSKQSPLNVLYPTLEVGMKVQVLPLATLFTVVHIFVHANLLLHLLPPTHPLRSTAATNSSNYLPLPYSILFGSASIAPVISLSLRHTWLEGAWWSAALLLTWFIYSGQEWVQEETKAIEGLEQLRYNARGA